MRSKFMVLGLGLALTAASTGVMAQETGEAPAAAAAGDAAILEKTIAVDIAAQALPTAIIELSRQARVQIVFQGERLDRYSAAAVQGEMSLKAAIEKLLQGTQASYRQSGPDVVTIEAPEPEVAEAVATVPVAAPQQEQKSESREDYGQQRLDDIIVTATKREKSARDIPVSISAVRGEDLEKMGARDMKDYMMQVPGLSMDEDNKGEAGGRRITVRGVGPSAVDGNQTVGQFIGDIPMTDPVGNRMTPDLDPFDLKTVEVLKGPQGTTFGATALNGAIRYVPNAPELGLLQARGFADYSRVKYGSPSKVFGLGANAPLGDTVALRVAGVLQDAGGLYDNVQRDQEDADSRRKWSGRAMLRWLPGEALSVDLMYLKQRGKSDDLLTADNDETFSNSFKPGPSTLVSQFDLGSVDARYDLDDWGTLVWQSSRQTKNVDIDSDSSLRAHGQFGIPLLRGYTETDVKGTTHELRWVSAQGERWSWIVGAFVQDYHLSYDTGLFVPTEGALSQLAQLLSLANTPSTAGAITARGITTIGSEVKPLSASERSLYGEVSRRIGEHWELTFGGRAYKTRVNGRVKNTGLTGFVNPEVVLGRDVPVEQAEKGFSPKLSLAWRPDQSLMVYALVARGFQFGGANNPPDFTFPNPVEGTHTIEYFSSTLWNREIGVRTDWFDRTLRFDATVYDIDWSNAQIKQVTQGTVFAISYIDNIGRVRSQGVETALTWLTPLSGLSLNVAAAYAKARTVAAVENNGKSTPPGATLPAAPPVQVSATAAYSTYFGPWVTNAGLTYSYWSKTYNNLQHDYELYDFGQYSVNLSTARPDWTGAPVLSLGVQNLLDERGLIGRFGTAAGVASNLVSAGVGEGWTYIRPRTISLRLTAQFD